MRPGVWIAVAAAVLAVAVLGGLAVYDHSRSDVIADGVRVGGVHVGGLTRSQAVARVRGRLSTPVVHDVVVHWGARRFVLPSARSGVRVDADATVAAALRRSRAGNVFGRALRGLSGGDVDARVAPVVRWSPAAVSSFVREVGDRIDRRARDADIDFVGYRIRRTPARSGRLLRRQALTAAIEARLRSLRRDPDVRAPVVVSRRPDRTLADLAKRYPSVITVSKTRKILRLYRDLKLARTYRVAIGQIGHKTPAGRYAIQTMQKNPAWHVPDEAWAGSLAGRVIPPGDPQNPLKARWMGFHDGAGIHGTAEISSLGAAASHGCIRMAVRDVVKLYRQVKVGTPVFIA